MARRNTKIDIIDAAGRVVLRDGVAGLTLEAVAAEAGLSKGGLLYHFGTKEALLEGMVARLIEVTEQRIADHLATDSAPGCHTRAFLRTCTVDGAPDTGPDGRLGVAVLAAGANQPALLDPLRAFQAAWRRRMRDDGIDPATAHLVSLAGDGLWLNDIFGLPALTDAERAAVLARAEALTHPDGDAPR